MSSAEIKLTALVKAGGCGSKLGPSDLRKTLCGLPSQAHKNFIFGDGHGDDAGVYQVREDLALVQTVDFFTPIVDDPYDFGAIAAANALSDCYVLGAEPITGLSIVAYPSNGDREVLRRILIGGADKVLESGAVIVGGHTVSDPEPKFGVAVTGTVHPQKMITNRNAKPGDLLILTKCIGTGIATNAEKSGKGKGPAGLLSEAVASMKMLNKVAARLMAQYGAHASTDVTGFGLLGHARNIAEASGVTFEINISKIPTFEGVRELALEFGGGAVKRNLDWMRDVIEVESGVTEGELNLVNDAQTSGPLLIALPEEKAHEFIADLKKNGVSNSEVIGHVVDRSNKMIRIKQ